MDKGQRQRRQDQMLERIEEDLAIPFQQRINQVEPGDVCGRIQPVIKPPTAGSNLQMAIKQNDNAQSQPERGR